MNRLNTTHYSLLLVPETALNPTSLVCRIAVTKPQTFQFIGLE
jgi:hypothetical protein